MELTAPYRPPEDFEYTPPAGFVDYWDWMKLKDHLSGVHTGRLAPWLRSAAATKNPLAILGKAVVARFSPTNTGNASAESQALADLAVTGRAAYDTFCTNRIDDAALINHVQPILSGKSQQQLQDAVRAVLDRAYKVAWTLRGSPSQRGALRPDLGWIAVSGEDDPPHAPVNLPCSDGYMGELKVVDGTSLLTLRATLLLPDNPAPDMMPDISKRQIPNSTAFTSALNNREAAGYDELFLFVHGLASRCEEAEIFKKKLIAKGAALGQRYAVLSVDMPGMGYSKRFDLDDLISRRTHGGFHGFKLPNGAGSNFPLLGLYSDTLVQICNNTPGGVQHVMGGSLGGNMTLWLAAEPMFTELTPANNKPTSVISFLAWSPASIWESYERSRDTAVEGNGTHMDIFKNAVKNRSYARMKELETVDTRWHFFEIPQRGEELAGIHILGAWGYPPSIENILLQSELYSEQYRRTFWAAGYEQVVFSHQEPLAPAGGLPFQKWPFKTINKPLFLASGAKDIGSGSGQPGTGRVADIFNNVVAVTEACPEVQGLRLLMLDIGHSIHDERPGHLGKKITDFLAALSVVPVVFEHNDYTGRRQCLNAGCYDLDQLSFGNDVISSVKVPPGWRVTLYQHAGFQGATKVLTGNTPALPDFNDMTSSIIVEKLTVETSLAVYEHIAYAGRSQVLHAGRYDLGQLSIGNDVISSVKVPPGWRVTLYQHAGFQGATKVLTDSTPALPDFNDMTSSIVVEDLWKTIPNVREMPKSVARTMLEAEGLVPVFTGSLCSNADAWVFSQSPMAGKRVPPGTQVTMNCRTGPQP